jgi:anti-sigma factor RsiW
MNGTNHLDAQRVYDLLDGRLDPAAESAAQAHLFRCDRCRELERECAGVVESLRWYGSERLEPPLGYWDAFWARWSPDAEPVVRLLAPRPPASRFTPALAVAAALALLAGLWWSERSPETAGELRTAEAPPLRQAVAGSGWADDYARFERMSIAVGGIDPVSKGIVLATLAEEP